MSMSKENSMKQTSITINEKLRSRCLPSSEDGYRGKKLKNLVVYLYQETAGRLKFNIHKTLKTVSEILS